MARSAAVVERPAGFAGDDELVEPVPDGVRSAQRGWTDRPDLEALAGEPAFERGGRREQLTAVLMVGRVHELLDEAQPARRRLRQVVARRALLHETGVSMTVVSRV